MGRKTKQLTLPSGRTAEIIEEFNYGESNSLKMTQLFDETPKEDTVQGETPEIDAAKMLPMIKAMRENKVLVHAKTIELGLRKLDGVDCTKEMIENLTQKDAEFIYNELHTCLYGEKKS